MADIHTRLEESFALTQEQRVSDHWYFFICILTVL
jgi:hypothetical protein